MTYKSKKQEDNFFMQINYYRSQALQSKLKNCTTKP